MLKGFDHTSEANRFSEISAAYTHWESHTRLNIDRVIDIILGAINHTNLKCMICGGDSLQYTRTDTLKNHYKNRHPDKVVKYYLKNIVKIAPLDLQLIIDSNIPRKTIQEKLCHDC